MNSSFGNLGNICPPLRLIVTSECNGRCNFCHNEGFSSSESMVMSKEIASIASSAAREVGINRITVSGGEPTLLPSLPSLLRAIRNAHPSVFLGIVTNGFRLPENWEKIEFLVDNIDVSIHSLRERVWGEYTRVDPRKIISFIEKHKKLRNKVKINTVLFNENISDFPSLIEIAKKYKISITAMIAISQEINNSLVNDEIKKIINNFKINEFKIGSTPTIISSISRNTNIEIKLPILSSIIPWRRCKSCFLKEKCGEGFCAIRVYQNGSLRTCRTAPLLGKADNINDMITLLDKGLKEMNGSTDDFSNIEEWLSEVGMRQKTKCRAISL